MSRHLETSLRRTVTKLTPPPFTESSNEAEKRAHARIKELQAALAESHSTLEAERSELEGLRRQEDDSTAASLADDLQRAQRDLATNKSELERAERESHQLGELVTRLRQDLRHAEAEIQRLAQQPQGQLSTQNEVNELRIIVDSLTAENKELHDRRGWVSEVFSFVLFRELEKLTTLRRHQHGPDHEQQGGRPPKTARGRPTQERPRDQGAERRGEQPFPPSQWSAHPTSCADHGTRIAGREPDLQLEQRRRQSHQQWRRLKCPKMRNVRRGGTRPYRLSRL